MRVSDLRLLFLMVCAVAGLSLLFPLASFTAAAVLLVNLPEGTPAAARRALIVVLAFSMALMTGARPLDPAASNDIDGYYLIYEDLRRGDLSEIMHFGGGFEVTMMGLFLLWGALLPKLTPNGLMFCLALTSALIFAAWVELTFYGKEDRRRGPALLAVCVFMLNLYFSTQLVRQFLSLVILLFAFSAANRWRALAWVLLSSSVHLTGGLFFVAYLLAKRGWKGWLVILGIAIMVRVYFADLLVAFDILPEVVAEKVKYYVENDEEGTASDLASLRMISLLGMISLVVLAAARGRVTHSARAVLALPWLTAIVHILLWPVPLASLRTTLAIHSVVPGVVAYHMFPKNQRVLQLGVLNLLVLYKTATMASADGLSNLASTVAMMSGFLE